MATSQSGADAHAANSAAQELLARLIDDESDSEEEGSEPDSEDQESGEVRAEMMNRLEERAASRHSEMRERAASRASSGSVVSAARSAGGGSFRRVHSAGSMLAAAAMDAKDDVDAALRSENVQDVGSDDDGSSSDEDEATVKARIDAQLRARAMSRSSNLAAAAKVRADAGSVVSMHSTNTSASFRRARAAGDRAAAPRALLADSQALATAITAPGPPAVLVSSRAVSSQEQQQVTTITTSHHVVTSTSHTSSSSHHHHHSTESSSSSHKHEAHSSSARQAGGAAGASEGGATTTMVTTTAGGSGPASAPAPGPEMATAAAPAPAGSDGVVAPDAAGGSSREEARRVLASHASGRNVTMLRNAAAAHTSTASARRGSVLALQRIVTDTDNAARARNIVEGILGDMDSSDEDSDEDSEEDSDEDSDEEGGKQGGAAWAEQQRQLKLQQQHTTTTTTTTVDESTTRSTQQREEEERARAAREAAAPVPRPTLETPKRAERAAAAATTDPVLDIMGSPSDPTAEVRSTPVGVRQALSPTSPLRDVTMEAGHLELELRRIKSRAVLDQEAFRSTLRAERRRQRMTAEQRRTEREGRLAEAGKRRTQRTMASTAQRDAEARRTADAERMAAEVGAAGHASASQLSALSAAASTVARSQMRLKSAQRLLAQCDALCMIDAESAKAAEAAARRDGDDNAERRLGRPQVRRRRASVALGMAASSPGEDGGADGAGGAVAVSLLDETSVALGGVSTLIRAADDTLSAAESLQARAFDVVSGAADEDDDAASRGGVSAAGTDPEGRAAGRQAGGGVGSITGPGSIGANDERSPAADGDYDDDVDAMLAEADRIDGSASRAGPALSANRRALRAAGGGPESEGAASAGAASETGSRRRITADEAVTSFLLRAAEARRAVSRACLAAAGAAALLLGDRQRQAFAAARSLLTTRSQMRDIRAAFTAMEGASPEEVVALEDERVRVDGPGADDDGTDDPDAPPTTPEVARLLLEAEKILALAVEVEGATSKVVVTQLRRVPKLSHREAAGAEGRAYEVVVAAGPPRSPLPAGMGAQLEGGWNPSGGAKGDGRAESRTTAAASDAAGVSADGAAAKSRPNPDARMLPVREWAEDDEDGDAKGGPSRLQMVELLGASLPARCVDDVMPAAASTLHGTDPEALGDACAAYMDAVRPAYRAAGDAKVAFEAGSAAATSRYQEWASDVTSLRTALEAASEDSTRMRREADLLVMALRDDRTALVSVAEDHDRLRTSLNQLDAARADAARAVNEAGAAAPEDRQAKAAAARRACAAVRLKLADVQSQYGSATEAFRGAASGSRTVGSRLRAMETDATLRLAQAEGRLQVLSEDAGSRSTSSVGANRLLAAVDVARAAVKRAKAVRRHVRRRRQSVLGPGAASAEETMAALSRPAGTVTMPRVAAGGKAEPPSPGRGRSTSRAGSGAERFGSRRDLGLAAGRSSRAGGAGVTRSRSRRALDQAGAVKDGLTSSEAHRRMGEARSVVLDGERAPEDEEEAESRQRRRSQARWGLLGDESDDESDEDEFSEDDSVGEAGSVGDLIAKAVNAKTRPSQSGRSRASSNARSAVSGVSVGAKLPFAKPQPPPAAAAAASSSAAASSRPNRALVARGAEDAAVVPLEDSPGQVMVELALRDYVMAVSEAVGAVDEASGMRRRNVAESRRGASLRRDLLVMRTAGSSSTLTAHERRALLVSMQERRARLPRIEEARGHRSMAAALVDPVGGASGRRLDASAAAIRMTSSPAEAAAQGVDVSLGPRGVSRVAEANVDGMVLDGGAGTTQWRKTMTTTTTTTTRTTMGGADGSAAAGGAAYVTRATRGDGAAGGQHGAVVDWGEERRRVMGQRGLRSDFFDALARLRAAVVLYRGEVRRVRDSDIVATLPPQTARPVAKNLRRTTRAVEQANAVLPTPADVSGGRLRRPVIAVVEGSVREANVSVMALQADVDAALAWRSQQKPLRRKQSHRREKPQPAQGDYPGPAPGQWAPPPAGMVIMAPQQYMMAPGPMQLQYMMAPGPMQPQYAMGGPQGYPAPPAELKKHPSVGRAVVSPTPRPPPGRDGPPQGDGRPQLSHRRLVGAPDGPQAWDAGSGLPEASTTVIGPAPRGAAADPAAAAARAARGGSAPSAFAGQRLTGTSPGDADAYAGADPARHARPRMASMGAPESKETTPTSGGGPGPHYPGQAMGQYPAPQSAAPYYGGGPMHPSMSFQGMPPGYAPQAGPMPQAMSFYGGMPPGPQPMMAGAGSFYGSPGLVGAGQASLMPHGSFVMAAPGGGMVPMGSFAGAPGGYPQGMGDARKSMRRKASRAKSMRRKPSGKGFARGDKAMYEEGEPTARVRVEMGEKSLKITRSMRRPREDDDHGRSGRGIARRGKSVAKM